MSDSFNTILTDNVNTINTNIINLDNKFVFKNGDSISGTLNVGIIDYNGDIKIGQSCNNIYIGSSNNIDQKNINIGGPNDIVNIIGNLNSIQTTNLQILNKLITLNEGATGINQSSNVGINIRDNDIDNKGYIRTNTLSNGFELKAPQSDKIYQINDDITNDLDLTSKIYVDNLILNMQNQIDVINQTLSFVSNQLIINTQTHDNLQLQINDINTCINLIYQLLILISNQIIINTQ
jgi:hypothetical protein